MRIDIIPEPSPEERAAIEQALALASANGSHEPSAWWRDGVREAVGIDGDEPGDEPDRSGPYSLRSKTSSRSHGAKPRRR